MLSEAGAVLPAIVRGEHRSWFPNSLLDLQLLSKRRASKCAVTAKANRPPQADRQRRRIARRSMFGNGSHAGGQSRCGAWDAIANEASRKVLSIGLFHFLVCLSVCREVRPLVGLF